MQSRWLSGLMVPHWRGQQGMGGQSASSRHEIRKPPLSRRLRPSQWLLSSCPQPSDPPTSCPWWKDRTSTAAWSVGASRWFSPDRTSQPSPKSCLLRRPQVRGLFELYCVHWPHGKATIFFLQRALAWGWCHHVDVESSALFAHLERFPRSPGILMLTQVPAAWMYHYVLKLILGCSIDKVIHQPPLFLWNYFFTYRGKFSQLFTAIKKGGWSAWRVSIRALALDILGS